MARATTLLPLSHMQVRLTLFQVALRGQVLSAATGIPQATGCSNSVPTANDDVHIPATAHTPVLTTDSAAVHSLITDSAANIEIDSTQLKVTGSIVTLNGNVTGNGWLLLSSIDTQIIHGKDTIANMELNNANGASISLADTINIKNNYNPGQWRTQCIWRSGHAFPILTPLLLSLPVLAMHTSMAPVTIHQYIHGGRRAFRFLGNPFSETISLSQLTRTIDITGDSGAVNGFTTNRHQQSFCILVQPAHW